MRYLTHRTIVACALAAMLIAISCVPELAEEATGPITIGAIEVDPKAASLEPGDFAQLSAQVFDAYGSPIQSGISWSSTNSSVASVSPSGRVSALAPGGAAIAASAGGKSDTSVITVLAIVAPVASVSVSPSSASVEVGKTQQLTATLKDASGNTLTGRSVSWATSSASVATVSSNGLVTGVGAGTAAITATSEGKSGQASIQVTAAPAPPPPPSSASEVLVGAGDIARCNSDNDEATAKLLDGIAGTVFTAGDNVYLDGTPQEFADCYHPTWGRHKARTRPSAGNHDYETSGATGYYNYFGESAGPAGKGYYSYDLGEWHIVVLNSNISRTVGSAQIDWLRADLDSSSKRCTLAYWHHPRFSSGDHGNDSSVQTFWDVLYEFGAEVIVTGHDHNYERFAPQTPAAVADPVRGIRSFVVGTGGTSLRSMSTTRANSEYRNASNHGVIRFDLSADGYRWAFVTTPNGSVVDSGSGTCR